MVQEPHDLVPIVVAVAGVLICLFFGPIGPKNLREREEA